MNEPLSINSITKNIFAPPRICFYGGAGIGKTTLASFAPNPVFILTEDGAGNLDLSHFPFATRYEDVTESINILLSDKHDFKTLVIDSLDWLEPLIWNYVCEKEKKENIESFGYGGGYLLASVVFRDLFSLLDRLRIERNMMIIFTAHSQIKKIEDPMVPTFDQYSIALQRRAASVAIEYCDVVCYLAFELNITKEDKGFGVQRTRAVGDGERLMYTQGSPAFVAKNRYSLPAQLPISWDLFFSHLTTSQKKGSK